MCDRQCSRSESKGKEIKWMQVENSNLDRDEEQARKTITLPTTRIR